ncbi:MAG: hypothetical protein EXS00_01805 [Phycisphaerales bacterium]|nr:hypothetical protein [Phycisphaerales bacterium]
MTWFVFDPWLWVFLGVMGVLYIRGWRGSRGNRWCFWSGVAVLIAALQSPIDSMAHLLLWVHMAQHVLLIFVAAPLLVLGGAGLACFRGLPNSVRRDFLGPLLGDPSGRAIWRFLLHPVTAWVAFTLSTWAWHMPSLYQLAIGSPFWHRVEHACFLGGAVLFWWQVIEPWPWKSSWSTGKRIVYVLAADVQNTLFCALLAFAGASLYPSYAATAWGLGWDPLRDQKLAAGLMWLSGQLVLLPAALWLLLRVKKSKRRTVPLPLLVAARAGKKRAVWDLLRLPLIGVVLSSRRCRSALRWILTAVACAIVLDGFLGPQVAPENLAGVLPWTHWRGITAIALIAVGNVACMACPFMAPRSLGKWMFGSTRAAPKWMRSKYLACALVVLWLATYESLDLWDSPLATAWLIIAYFAIAFAVDSLFAGATFCRSVCPLGQYQMMLSLVSPTQVAARDPMVCVSCTTHDCLRGNASRGVPGCGLDLFVPQKLGSLDCTSCLDCADACPHDNVGVLVQSRASNLLDVSLRSGIGFLAQRRDIGLLLLLLIVGAFVNAAAMTPPWIEAVESLRSSQFMRPLWGSDGSEVSEFVAVALAISASVALIWLVSEWTSRRVGQGVTPSEVLVRGALALVPLGAAMWVVHFGFHLVTAWSTAWAVIQRCALDVGFSASLIGEPDWIASCCAEVPLWLKPLEIVILDLGFVATAYLVWRTMNSCMAQSQRAVSDAGPSNQSRESRATIGSVLPLAAPWLLMAAAWFLIGLWIVLQPMQMRGNLMP